MCLCRHYLLGGLDLCTYFEIGPHFLDSSIDAFCHIEKGFVRMRPITTRDRFSIGWQCLEFTKWRSLPKDRTYNNRNNPCLALLMSFNGPRHLLTIAIVRVHKR